MNDSNTLYTMKHIGNAKLAEEINAQLENAGIHAVALTGDLNLQSTQDMHEFPLHYKALYKTPIIEEFAAYTNEQPSATVFIENESMAATAIFDIGTPQEPKNRFHKAAIQLSKTAEFITLTNINNHTFSQRDLAVWMEENYANITTLGKEEAPGMDAPSIELNKAIHAIRNTEIKAKAESSNKIEDLSEQTSVMASVEVKNDGNKPAYIDFTCNPYHGLKLPLQAPNQNDDDNMQRTFRIRINVITDGEKPRFTLKIMQYEQHKEVMVEAFKKQLKEELNQEVTVRIGTFS